VPLSLHQMHTDFSPRRSLEFCLVSGVSGRVRLPRLLDINDMCGPWLVLLVGGVL
jgi:hypothetical protein